MNLFEKNNQQKSLVSLNLLNRNNSDFEKINRRSRNKINTEKTSSIPTLKRGKSEFFEGGLINFYFLDYHSLLKKDYLHDGNLDSYPISCAALIRKSSKLNNIKLEKLVENKTSFGRKNSVFALMNTFNENQIMIDGSLTYSLPKLNLKKENERQSNEDHIEYPEHFKSRLKEQNKKMIFYKSFKKKLAIKSVSKEISPNSTNKNIFNITNKIDHHSLFLNEAFIKIKSIEYVNIFFKLVLIK